MIGPINHLHVEDMAVAMAEHDFDVIVAGNSEVELPPTSLPGRGITVFEAPPAPHDTPLGILANVRWIRRLHREVRPDVVHAHWLCGFAAFAAIAGAKPLVSMAWGSDVLRATRVKNVANRIALRGSSLAVADSQQLLERMVGLGMSPDRVALVSHGVDLESFSPPKEPRESIRERLGLGTGAVVLGPRSLLPMYNPDTIVDAFARVADRFPDAQLVLLGLFNGDVRVDGRIDPERVHIVGRVEHAQMAEYFRAADVAISIPSSDGTPRTVWEAMACGCPVVVSDLPWVREFLVPETHALVVPIDAQRVAAAVEQVLGDPARAAALGASGRALAVALQGRDAAMQNLADLYLSVIRSGD